VEELRHSVGVYHLQCFRSGILVLARTRAEKVWSEDQEGVSVDLQAFEPAALWALKLEIWGSGLSVRKSRLRSPYFRGLSMACLDIGFRHCNTQLHSTVNISFVHR